LPVSLNIVAAHLAAGIEEQDDVGGSLFLQGKYGYRSIAHPNLQVADIHSNH